MPASRPIVSAVKIASTTFSPEGTKATASANSNTIATFRAVRTPPVYAGLLARHDDDAEDQGCRHGGERQRRHRRRGKRRDRLLGSAQLSELGNSPDAQREGEGDADARHRRGEHGVQQLLPFDDRGDHAPVAGSGAPRWARRAKRTAISATESAETRTGPRAPSPKIEVKA